MPTTPIHRADMDDEDDGGLPPAGYHAGKIVAVDVASGRETSSEGIQLTIKLASGQTVWETLWYINKHGEPLSTKRLGAWAKRLGILPDSNDDTVETEWDDALNLPVVVQIKLDKGSNRPKMVCEYLGIWLQDDEEMPPEAKAALRKSSKPAAKPATSTARATTSNGRPRLRPAPQDDDADIPF